MVSRHGGWLLGAALATGILAACSQGRGVLPTGAGVLNPNLQTASGSGYKSIYSFGAHGKADDGAEPASGLVELGGAFYGTTQYGGRTNAACALGCGVVFRMTPEGDERVVYRFAGGKDGALPLGGLTVVRGAIVGTTSEGGGAAACAGGCGTIFSVNVERRSEKILYSFAGKSDGADPVSGLIDAGGTLYGTTQFGGTATNLCASGCGTIFALSSGDSESVVHRFKGRADGAYPTGGLLSLRGALYGTTEYGGAQTRFCASGCGTIFQLSGTAKKTIHDFAYGRAADGAYPAASLIVLGGKLYGTTAGGGTHGNGTAFSASISSSAEKVLHSFQCCQTEKDGAYPIAPLTVVRGNLYGVTREGGNGNNGTVFLVTTSGVETLLYQFAGNPDGQFPEAALSLLRGTLYGTTANGGLASEGTAFRVAPIGAGEPLIERSRSDDDGHYQERYPAVVEYGTAAR
jgi:uncharacterized repeat protein (TIGR03803 family)